MQSVLAELHALIHPPMFKHPNIIDFLGRGRGSKSVSPLIVEYVDHGTLSQFLGIDKNLEFETKHLLCLDVARGLSALHQAGPVGGDIKTDNVLVFSGADWNCLAKISDFGFSIVATLESSDV